MKKIFMCTGILLFIVLGACTWVNGGDSNELVMDNGLIIKDVKIGEGEPVKSGDTIKADYKGMLEDGTQFDSSYDRGEAAVFPIGIGYLIQGWEQGIPGMKPGGIRKLTIPASLAYGDAGAPDAGIPGGATLIFEIELIEIL